MNKTLDGFDNPITNLLCKMLLLCCLVVVMGALVGLCVGVVKFGGYSVIVMPSAVLMMIITARVMWAIVSER